MNTKNIFEDSQHEKGKNKENESLGVRISQLE